MVEKMQDWSVDQVCQWLTSLKRDPAVIEEFRQHKISGFALSQLEEKHFERMHSVTLGDHLTILGKRNEVLQKEQVLETSVRDYCEDGPTPGISGKDEIQTVQSHSSAENSPQQDVGTSYFTGETESVFSYIGQETQQPQKEIKDGELVKVQLSENDHLHDSFLNRTEQTEINFCNSLHTGIHLCSDITATTYQAETSLQETEEMVEASKHSEKVNTLLTSNSQKFQITAVNLAAEMMPGAGDHVDNIMPKGFGTKTSESNEDVIQVSRSEDNEHLLNSCKEHSVRLQANISESNVAQSLESISCMSLMSINHDIRIEASSDRVEMSLSLGGVELLKSNEPISELPLPAGGEILSDSDETLKVSTLKYPIEHYLPESHLDNFTCREPATEFVEISELSTGNKEISEAKSEQGIAQLSMSGNECTSGLVIDSLENFEKMTQCENLASVSGGIQMEAARVSGNLTSECDNEKESEGTEKTVEVENVLKPEIYDGKQTVAKFGISSYNKPVFKINTNKSDENKTEEQNLQLPEIVQSSVLGRTTRRDLETTVLDSDKMSKHDAKACEVDQKLSDQGSESTAHAVATMCPISERVSSEAISQNPSRRFKTKEELFEFKRKQKQLQSAKSHLSPPYSKTFSTMADDECLIQKISERSKQSKISERSKQSASNISTILSQDKSALSPITQINQSLVVGQGTLNANREVLQDTYLPLEMKAANCSILENFQEKPSVSEMQINCTQLVKSFEASNANASESIEALSSAKLEPRLATESHNYKTNSKQSKVSMMADTSTLQEELLNIKKDQPEQDYQFQSACMNTHVPVQSSVTKKKPFSKNKLQTKTRKSSSKKLNSSPSVSFSETVSDQKSSVKLIGKNVLHNISEEKLLCSAVTSREQETVKADQLPSEVLRKIGSPADMTFKYRHGAKVSTSEGYPCRNLLYPVHQFALIEKLKDVSSLTEFSKEVLKFACACLNNRTNGIIHFGIASGSHSSLAVYGEIVGVVLDREPNEYRDFLRKAIRKCFNEAQVEAVSQCVIGPEFIEAVSTGPSLMPKLFVIEIDVIPKHRVCMEQIFSVMLPTKEKGCFEAESTFCIIDSVPRRLEPREEIEFRKNVVLFAAERKELEEQSKLTRKIETDLSRKFIHLFCHGSENLFGDHYHILVVNKPDGPMDREYMEKALSFIAEIEWKVVFDFDSEATLCNFVQEQEKPIKINMTDDFCQRSKFNIQQPDRLKQMLDNLKKSECPTWLFANGYEPQGEEPQMPRQWKKSRAEGFKLAVRFFGDHIPEGRATVMFLLLSKETEVILEAADELMTIFYNQWMCVAEKEEIGKPWIEELIRRNCVEPDNFENNVVWGMPWTHVQETVTHILGPKKYSVCELPTSTGTYIPVNNKMNNELTDLEILGSFECDNAEIQSDEEQLKQYRKKVEEDFYKGNRVLWWNFWFRQVCGRDILEPAKKNVLSAINNEDDAVGKVFVYHQPGAGATTLAKNILWDFRKDSRCAVVRKISDNQTAGQVLKLFWYEDKDPKPVLLLLDNPDADKLNLLYADLCEMTRCIVKNNGEVPRVVCVLLVCSRLCTRSVEFDPKRLMLRHELSKGELNWFQDRYKYLQAEFAHKENSDIRPLIAVHPRLLISFNVMKENFNPDYIHRTVKELVLTVTDPKEQKLLKYVSLLNTFDLECRPIPSSSLDGMMLEIPWLNQGGLRYGLKAKSNRWETKLSAEVRVLLNETSETSLGKIHSLRIANPLLSREILNVLRNNGSVPIGDIALEFLGNKEIFNTLCLPRDNLVDIIKDVLKRRQQKGGKPETAFSPLIQHIVDHESIDAAVDVMKKVLALTLDPYIDQQLARLYIKAQNWEMATEFAKKATDQRPENSFFWDTYGRIYERQLVEEYEKLAKDTIPHDVCDFIHVIKTALDGMQMFRKVQETSEQEKTTIFSNRAGFFGELQMVVCLLDCLTYVFRDKDELRAFILTDLVPAECRMLKDIDGRNYLEELKTLEKHVQQAMNRLEDELLQLRDETLYEYQRTNYSKYEIDSLLRLKENLDSYFGEELDNAPDNFSEKDQCDFRRRRVFRLASHNIGSIFDLRWKDKGEESLVRIRRIALQNLETTYANAEDYRVAICVNLALSTMDTCISSLHDVSITFDDMVEWSTKLYTLRETSIVIHLEPYLFYVMFNWPRKNTKHSVVPKRLETALRQWKAAYYTKYPRQKDEGKPYRKKDTTLFFLANGKDMASIYTKKNFEERGSRRINEHRGRDSFWKMPDTVRKLQRFDGFLSGDGNEVSVHLHYSQGNKALLKIPTSLPIQNRNMWNKKVYFVIGFSWNGPRAFDVSLTDPTLVADMDEDHTLNRNIAFSHTFVPTRRLIPVDYTQEDFCRIYSEIMDELQKINRIEEKLKENSAYTVKPEEIDLLKRKSKLEADQYRLFKVRRQGMVSRIPDFTVFTTN